MKQITKLVPLLIAAVLPLAAMADLPGKHPAYLHALSDLRAARWLIEHRPSDAKVSADEDVALTHVVATIEDVKRAAAQDGKDVRIEEPTDSRLDRKGQLHHAEDLLRQAHDDIAQQEDDPMTRALRDRAVKHVDEAIRATHRAIVDAERGA